MTYCEHPAPPDLSASIATYWRIQGATAEGVDVHHRVLPDGCADLLFDLEGTRNSSGRSGMLVGPMLAAQSFQLRGTMDLVGIRFRPGGAAQFFGIAMQLIRDCAAPLSDLLQPNHFNVPQLAELPNSSILFDELTGALRRRLPRLPARDSIVTAALKRLTVLQDRPAPAISTLVRSLGVGERALERRFTAHVGLTPVQYRRLARFRASLKKYASGCTSWSDIAVSTGFSDQSHFVREFRLWAGISPTEWAADQTTNVGFVQDGNVSIF